MKILFQRNMKERVLVVQLFSSIYFLATAITYRPFLGAPTASTSFYIRSVRCLRVILYVFATGRPVIHFVQRTPDAETLDKCRAFYSLYLEKHRPRNNKNSATVSINLIDMRSMAPLTSHKTHSSVVGTCL